MLVIPEFLITFLRHPVKYHANNGVLCFKLKNKYFLRDLILRWFYCYSEIYVPKFPL